MASTHLEQMTSQPVPVAMQQAFLKIKDTSAPTTPSPGLSAQNQYQGRVIILWLPSLRHPFCTDENCSSASILET